MRIGISCLEISPKSNTGTKTYIIGLLNGLIRDKNKIEIILFVKKKNRGDFMKYLSNPNIEMIVFNNHRFINYLRHYFATWGLEKLHHIISNIGSMRIAKKMDELSDIIYIPSTVLYPYNLKKPTLLSMHDIQQKHFPEFFSEAILNKRKITFKLSALYTDNFQSSSNFIKNDLLDFFPNLINDRIKVIHPGINIEEFSLSKNCEHATKLISNLPEKYLFFPAQLWRHKNHIIVLEALKRIKTNYSITIPFVFTGQRNNSNEYIFEFISSNNLEVIHLGNVSFSVLKSLYRHAFLLINPVLYEASSFPILEAAASGLPILASDTEPNKELGQILQINYFVGSDINSLVNEILKLWNNVDLLTIQASNNIELVRYFDWINVSNKYIEYFKEIYEKKNRI